MAHEIITGAGVFTVVSGLIAVVYRDILRRVKKVEDKCERCNPLVIETNAHVKLIMEHLKIEIK